MSEPTTPLSEAERARLRRSVDSARQHVGTNAGSGESHPIVVLDLGLAERLLDERDELARENQQVKALLAYASKRVTPPGELALTQFLGIAETDYRRYLNLDLMRARFADEGAHLLNRFETERAYREAREAK